MAERRASSFIIMIKCASVSQRICLSEDLSAEIDYTGTGHLWRLEGSWPYRPISCDHRHCTKSRLSAGLQRKNGDEKIAPQASARRCFR